MKIVVVFKEYELEEKTYTNSIILLYIFSPSTLLILPSLPILINLYINRSISSKISRRKDSSFKT